MLLKILYKTIVVFIKFHELQAAIVIYFKSACWIVIKLHINESKIYTQITMNFHSDNLIRPQKNPSKLPPSNLMTLFYCFVWQLESYGPSLPLNWSIPEKNQTEEVEDMEFPGLLKK